ncbi:protein SET DOMAIN GROUP 40-like isoform X2 [Pistacia vera]|uniref:protein SET DOMAIN GROUP 40-like isoform X2 n=1 Tax=Pistacia vera TaxID=55513 RepID=UPI00126357B4|nr:protein SET DOMAIN GROUP 40-like isoform X2 [Pistacia vera]XP_031281836.1 protein SET DOMAIN GROUP 40-like isoform X2 [Pistacia vera]
METEEKQLENLLKWAAHLGITDSSNGVPSHSHSSLGHSLTISHFPLAGGRGLGAVRGIREGELILKVPKSALFTTRSLLNKDHNLSHAVNSHPSLSSAQILTVDDAIWAAGKAVLKAEIEWKEASKLMEQLQLKPQFVSFKAWLWASGTVSSRTMYIAWDEAGCLCPVGDLFNYAAPGEEPNGLENVGGTMNASSLTEGDGEGILDSEKFNPQLQRLTDGWFEEEANAYCFYARQSYEKGEQVLLSYGTYTNLELLEHYGFLLDENPNDKFFIPLDTGIYSSGSWPKESQYIHQNGKPSFALLSALRLWLTPANQRRSVGHLAYSGCQLSVDNEVSVMKWISKKCLGQLKNLPTSSEEDNLLLSTIDKIQDYKTPMELKRVLSTFGGEACTFLEDNGVQSGKNGGELSFSGKTKLSIERWKLAVQWRLRYKTTLADCISYCSEIINSLLCKNVSTVRTKELMR